ncbi:hypothetical protein Tco_0805391, partial [Tanacetum coccineum]
DVIVNGDLEEEPAPTTGETSAPPAPKTAKQLAAKKNQERVKSILLLAIPDEYLLKFHNPEFEGYGPKTSKSASKDISNEVRKSNDAPMVEKLVSDDKSEKKIVFPTVAKIEFVKSKQQEKPVRKPVKYAKMYRSQKPRGNQRNWNNQKSQQLGNDFVMHNKACYVCGSFDHLQYTCKQKRQLNGQREEKPVWNNARRVNHQNSPRITHPNPKRHMVPRKILTRSGPISLNTARQSHFNAVRTNRVNAVKASACWVWRPIKPNSASITLKRYDYVDVRGRSRISMEAVVLLDSELKGAECGVNLLLGTCLNCTYGDGKPVTYCGCEGPLKGGFCSFCASRDGNSFDYNPNPNSFNESQNFSDYPPQPQQALSQDDIKKLMSKLLEDVRIINEELSEFINSPSWNHPTFYNDDDEYTVIYRKPKAITPDLPTEEPDNSLSMGDEHLNTIPEIEKYSVENLVPIPSEFKGISEDICDMPSCDNDYFDAECGLINSFLSRDSSITSPKIDFLPEEFVGKLNFIDPILPGIDEDNFDEDDFDEEEGEIDIFQIEDEILREKLLNVNLLVDKIEALKLTPSIPFVLENPSSSPIPVVEEVDTFLVPEDSIPPGIESDFDSEGDIVFLDNLLNDDLFWYEHEGGEIDVSQELKMTILLHLSFGLFSRIAPTLWILLYFSPPGVKTPFLTPTSPLRAGGILSGWNFHVL